MSLFRMSKTITGNLMRGPATLMYPRVTRKPYLNTRGRIGIDIDACIFCGLCQRRCPPKAIAVAKDSKTWVIDRLYCITCNVCVEVCPVHCLRMDREHSEPMVRREPEIHGQQPKEGAAEAASQED